MGRRWAHGPVAALAALLLLPLWGTAGCGGAEQVEAPAELKPFLPLLSKDLQPARVVVGRLVEQASTTNRFGLPIPSYRYQVLSDQGEWLGSVLVDDYSLGSGSIKVQVVGADGLLAAVLDIRSWEPENLLVAAFIGRDGRRIGTASLFRTYGVAFFTVSWPEPRIEARLGQDGRWYVKEGGLGRLIGTVEPDGTARRALR